MRHYRFFILLAFCISCLGLTSKISPEIGVKLALINVSVAQTVETDTSPSANGDSSTYDQLMKTGYDLTNQKNYPEALANFQAALEKRPDDFYAQKAIENVQSYLAQTNTSQTPPTTSSEDNSWPVIPIVATILLTLALAGALVSLLAKYRPNLKLNKEERVARLNSNSAKSQSDNGSVASDTDNQTSFNYPNSAEEGDTERETSLPVQATTRIPNTDLILELISNLRDPEPKVQRRAIWKLAQVSDSRSMQHLVDAMIDADSYDRSLILEALAQICTRTLRPMNQALAISLQDKNPQVRKNAIRDLTRLYDMMSQISQLICHALDDSDEEVQETAKWAIRQLNLQIPPRLEIVSPETTTEVEGVEESSYTESTEV